MHVEIDQNSIVFYTVKPILVLLALSRDEWKEKTSLDHCIKKHIFPLNSLRILTLILLKKQQTATAQDFQAFPRVLIISRVGELRR